MARIRTIKPEFPQSESMGAVSRDARLLFIMLFTLADDEGRLRGNSRMLASLLFPYDIDAPKLIDKWINELVKQRCIIQYQIEDATYIQICKWLNHQKIDKPSKSKIQPPNEHSITFESIREDSLLDQGEDQGSKDQGKDQVKEQIKKIRATRLPIDWEPDEMMICYCKEKRPDLQWQKVAENFKDYWIAQPDANAKKTDWVATWRRWVRNEKSAIKSYESAKDKERRETLEVLTGKKKEIQNEFVDLN